MKRLVTVLLGTIWLAGCGSSGPAVEELDRVPREVEEAIETEHSLQMIDNGTASYLVFRTYLSVKPEFETRGSTLIIDLKEAPPKSDQIKTHVYKVETDWKLDTIETRINGEPAPFAVITSI
ncbi:hypothetical protein [Edaphobacillus lindanitolerans]|uniref:Uncharacterized protein n=1 Tax=Edaphobacillus lindanitolerans TaxID=550447 RepID=A0A1U7PPI6_9BACI|nr:hypothetical protein [Edaphobacillus lindanitolerans]SIT88451.1 hypothetical protein SAMN05428946_2276 [Edaphobacillus lindanitolerans]